MQRCETNLKVQTSTWFSKLSLILSMNSAYQPWFWPMFFLLRTCYHFNLLDVFSLSIQLFLLEILVQRSPSLPESIFSHLAPAQPPFLAQFFTQHWIFLLQTGASFMGSHLKVNFGCRLRFLRLGCDFDVGLMGWIGIFTFFPFLLIPRTRLLFPKGKNCIENYICITRIFGVKSDEELTPDLKQVFSSFGGHS